MFTSPIGLCTGVVLKGKIRLGVEEVGDGALPAARPRDLTVRDTLFNGTCEVVASRFCPAYQSFPLDAVGSNPLLAE